MARKPIVLVPLRCYLPGFRSGGPVRSVSNLVERLGDDYQFMIACLDRDAGDTLPYADAKPGKWIQHGKSMVTYLDPWSAGQVNWRSLAADIKADSIYFNSLFDIRFSILPLATLGGMGRQRIVLAPRGELSRGALMLKPRRKAAFLHLARLLRSHSGLRWHATSETEADDIRREFPEADGAIEVAANLAGREAPAQQRQTEKTPGSLRIVFLSRITEKKNLTGALRMVRQLSGDVMFDIWGPIEDAAYWKACQDLIVAMPHNVRVAWRGELPHELVAETLARYDVLLLPTFGENFGHVIVEALRAGVPAVISDRTPWLGLAQDGIGAALPLDDDHPFVLFLQRYQAMDTPTLAAVRNRARAYMDVWMAENTDLSAYRRMFDGARPRRTL